MKALGPKYLYEKLRYISKAFTNKINVFKMGKLEDRMGYSCSFVFFSLHSDTIYKLFSAKIWTKNQNIQSKVAATISCWLRGSNALNSFITPPWTDLNETYLLKITGVIKLNTITMHVMERSQERLDCLQLILQRYKFNHLYTQKKQLKETPFTPYKFTILSRLQQKILKYFLLNLEK